MLPNNSNSNTVITVNGFNFSQELLDKLRDFFVLHTKKDVHNAIFQTVCDIADNFHSNKDIIPIVSEIFEMYNLVE